MTVAFSKYQGTGNDFIMLDNTAGAYDILSISHIQRLCARKFGIGADGLILIQKHPDYNFEMRYYNADGSQSFCGNGARCAVAYAASLGLLPSAQANFLAIDGPHEAWLCQDEVKLKMSDVAPVKSLDNAFVVQTGSPHYVLLDDNHSHEHVVKIGKSIRYSAAYNKEGINVNLLEILQNKIRVATYERGVEDETLSCGTGVTAAALIYAHLGAIPAGKVQIETKGGELMVEWTGKPDHSYTAVYLSGPAQHVYNGIYEFEG